MKSKNHQVKPKEKIATTPNMTLLFAMGFAAIASVILFGYVYITNHEHASQSVVTVKGVKGAQAPIETTDTSIVSDPENEIIENLASKLPQPKSEMVPPSLETLQGFWVFQVHEKSTAELSISGDQYQLIYADQSQMPIHKFSRGFISYDEKNGRLTLRHDHALGGPEPMRGVQYEILTTRIFDVDVLKANGGDEIHLFAPKEHIKSKAIHPLFLFANYNGPYILKLSPLEPKQ